MIDIFLAEMEESLHKAEEMLEDFKKASLDELGTTEYYKKAAIRHMERTINFCKSECELLTWYVDDVEITPSEEI